MLMLTWPHIACNLSVFLSHSFPSFIFATWLVNKLDIVLILIVFFLEFSMTETSFEDVLEEQRKKKAKEDKERSLQNKQKREQYKKKFDHQKKKKSESQIFIDVSGAGTGQVGQTRHQGISQILQGWQISINIP